MSRLQAAAAAGGADGVTVQQLPLQKRGRDRSVEIIVAKPPPAAATPAATSTTTTSTTFVSGAAFGVPVAQVFEESADHTAMVVGASSTQKVAAGDMAMPAPTRAASGTTINKESSK